MMRLIAKCSTVILSGMIIISVIQSSLGSGIVRSDVSHYFSSVLSRGTIIIALGLLVTMLARKGEDGSIEGVCRKIGRLLATSASILILATGVIYYSI